MFFVVVRWLLSGEESSVVLFPPVRAILGFIMIKLYIMIIITIIIVILIIQLWKESALASAD